jgi:hypothetical protein
MTTTKTIAELEAASNAATAAYEHALDRAAKIRSVVNALWEAECASEELPADVLTSVSSQFAALAPVRVRLRREIESVAASLDALEDAKFAAARALNDAPEEAA